MKLVKKKNSLFVVNVFFSYSYFPMSHILDNPCWNALNSGNNNLAEGNEQVKFFPAEVSPFVGLPEWNPYGFKQLYEVIPAGRRIAFMNLDEVEIPGEWDVIDYLEALQMVYPNPPSGSTPSSEIVHLHNNNIPQMMALTEMTHPGPFFKRTIEFGNYEGIFKGDELVSMAGQRMHAGDYVEISAVCTHPGHKGKGYASELIISQVRQIRSAAIPFLHVKDDNLHAIKLYKSLGFEVRKQMHIYSIRKK
jgi:GNAT superfamily N-acetyltransferase